MMNDSRGVPSFVWGCLAALVMCVASILVFGHWRAGTVCDSIDDTRAMWLWLADYALRPDGSNAEAIQAMLNELDERIPACEGGPTPTVGVPATT